MKGEARRLGAHASSGRRTPRSRGARFLRREADSILQFRRVCSSMIYFELHARSAFSFLRGASNPEDLCCAAARLDLPALALCDRDGLYGSPRLHAAAKEQGIRAFVGAELTLEDKSILPVLVASRTGYQNLCRLVTNARLRGTKTESDGALEGTPRLCGRTPRLDRRRRRHPSGIPAIRKLQKSSSSLATDLWQRRMFLLKSSATCDAEKPGATNSSWHWPARTNCPLVATNGVLLCATRCTPRS